LGPLNLVAGPSCFSITSDVSHATQTSVVEESQNFKFLSQDIEYSAISIEALLNLQSGDADIQVG
jgi:hypothetical protein